MRYTKEDKKAIAEAQGQYKYERDEWTGELYFIGYRCKKCKRVFIRLDDLEVDHIKPRSKGGTDRPSNLQLLCPICNKRKGTAVKRGRSTVQRKRR
jgi:5-methylcytosine-specific restriction endonuclease McrA